MSERRYSQFSGFKGLSSGVVIRTLIFSALLFIQTGCAKQLGQHLCASDQCFGQDSWQQSIDRITAFNFPEEHYHGSVYSDRLNNAWTTNDTNVNISEDLLYKLVIMGDAYVSSVSAHEIAHIQSHHYSRKASLPYISSLGSSATDSFSYRGKRQKALAMLSRQHELEADLLAVQYLEKAGYRREDYLNFLKWMKSNLKDASQSDLATHPSINERIARIEKPTSFVILERPGLK